jgi:RNA polymerase sigma-70 factor (ECF subfamily)
MRACRNRSLNYIRRSLSDLEHGAEIADKIYEQYDITDILIREETEVSIQKIIDRLPIKCKLIFNLSRFEELTYNEIAAQLGISSKTVENQISKALKILRDKLYKNQYDS